MNIYIWVYMLICLYYVLAMEWVPMFMKIDSPNAWDKDNLASVLENYPQSCDLIKITYFSLETFEMMTRVLKSLLYEANKLREAIKLLMLRMLSIPVQNEQTKVSVNLIVPGEESEITSKTEDNVLGLEQSIGLYFYSMHTFSK